MVVFRRCWLLLAIFLAACSGGSDSEKSTSSGTFNPPSAFSSPDVPDPIVPLKPAPAPGRTHFRYSANDGVDRTDVTEQPVSKGHTINLQDNTIPFTATAGHLIAYDWAKSPAKTADLTKIDAQAAISYTAYTRDDLPRDTRPVTFVFNGGPGGGSAVLDVGFLGPKVFDVDASKAANSFILNDNPNTLLDKTDLVFVDPVGTGYSEAILPHKNVDFGA